MYNGELVGKVVGEGEGGGEGEREDDGTWARKEGLSDDIVT